MAELSYENFRKVLKSCKLCKTSFKTLLRLFVISKKFKSEETRELSVYMGRPPFPLHHGHINLEVLLTCAMLLSAIPVVKLLLENGVKLEKLSLAQFELGCSRFLKKVNTSKNMLLLLLEHGLQETVKNHWKNGTGILNNFLYHLDKPDPRAVEVIEMILNHRLSCVNKKDIYGRSPLHRACKIGDVNLISLLIERGADVNMPYETGIRPLMYAISLNRMYIVDLFVSHGAEINAKTFNGHTALHNACTMNNPIFIDYLIQNGADVCAQTSTGETPLSKLNSGRNPLALTAMVKNIAKLKYEKKCILDSDIQLIKENPEMQQHFDACILELNKISSTVLWKRETFYSLLRRTVRIEEKANLAKNLEFIRNTQDRISCNFQIFKYNLIVGLQEAINIWNDKLIVEMRLKIILKETLPDSVIEKLAQNLKIEDVPL